MNFGLNEGMGQFYNMVYATWDIFLLMQSSSTLPAKNRCFFLSFFCDTKVYTQYDYHKTTHIISYISIKACQKEIKKSIEKEKERRNFDKVVIALGLNWCTPLKKI
jgi:hypothetical protein